MKYLFLLVWLYFMVIGAMNGIELIRDALSPSTPLLIRFLAVLLALCLILGNFIVYLGVEMAWKEDGNP